MFHSEEALIRKIESLGRMLGKTPENVYSLEKEVAQRPSAKSSGAQRHLHLVTQILQRFPPKASPERSKLQQFSTGPCCPSLGILRNDDWVNRNTPLNLIWGTVQCPNSLATPYRAGRICTTEASLLLSAAESTTSPRLPNPSTAATEPWPAPAPRLVALHVAALRFTRGLAHWEARPNSPSQMLLSA